MDSVLDALLESLAELVPYTCARVLVPEGGSHVLALAERQQPNPKVRSNEYPLTLDADKSPFLRRILAAKHGVLISDTNEEEEWQTFIGHAHLRSWLSIPLVASEEYLGFLSIGHDCPNSLTREHMRKAQLLGVPAAAAIQSARLFECADIYGSELQKRLTDLDQALASLASAEEDKRHLENTFQQVFRSSPVAFSITTLKEGRFMDVNVAFEELYGYPRVELIGRTVKELAIWAFPEDRAAMITELSKGGCVRNVITQLRAKSGEMKVTAYSAARIQFESQECALAVSQEVLAFDSSRSN
jgi:PAS domain S-box-containing protein